MAGIFPNDPARGRGFTLIELMIVMTLLAIVIAVAVPSLSGFFRGRSLDSEGRRLLALTHAGQSRAVSEGMPMVLWLDMNQRSYGLEEEAGYVERDTKAREFTLDRELQLKVATTAGGTPAAARRGANTSAAANGAHRNLPQIRFLPDGTVDEDSPASIQLLDRDGNSLALALARSNRMNYEIRSPAN